MLEPTPYFEEFKRYYYKAKLLQDEANLGGKPYDQVLGVNDDLMQSVTIYDTVERKHAGFSNMLQDLWHGTKAPKFYKQSEDRIKHQHFYDHHTKQWPLEVWAYMFLTHRLTGSGASFESDHGYRNTIIPTLAMGRNLEEIQGILKNMYVNEGAPKAFTSIGNQIPAFPKTNHYAFGQGIHYLYQDAMELAEFLGVWLPRGERKTIRQVYDFMCKFNKDKGYRQFKFPFSAAAADFADYFPEYVDPASEFNHGKNAIEALGYMFIKPKGMNQDNFLDEALGIASDAVGGFQYDVEDVCCDSIRWIENYVPLGKKGTYEHLCLDSVWNSSRILSHGKGRQKWHLEANIISTHNNRKNFSDWAVLDEHWFLKAEDQPHGKELNDLQKRQAWHAGLNARGLNGCLLQKEK